MNKKKLGLTKEHLKFLYLTKKKTSKEIAILFNCCDGTILNRLHKYKIPVNPPAHIELSIEARKKISLARQGKKLSEKHKESISLGGLGKHTRELNSNWKGGRIRTKGYVLLRLPEHPKANNRYVGEHIVIMEKILGRFLTEKELVHHKNEIRDDNSEKNLKLFRNQSEHIRFHNLQRGKRK